MDCCDDQSEVIAFLARPASYGARGPVERIDTHAAIVFLVGDHAYKLKRAVRYAYLDFSTLERRQEVCEAELALNRRSAPELYCRVEKIGRVADGSLVLGRGVAVDWLVVMRRFPHDCLFDVMARQHRLGAGLIRDLADRIAAFHAGAEPVFAAGAMRMRRVIEGNRASMAALPPGLLPPGDADTLARRGLALLAQLAPLLERRVASGHVRHCHGDLHLGNICLWQGRPTLFDCLEFDADLATTDVLHDLAFVVMDLWHRDLHGEASLLFNRYCDMTGEGEGLAALPLFMATRAGVRAHVEASAAARQTNAVQRQGRLAAARGYLAAALRFLEPAAPRLVAIGGLSGSGKSTLAGGLAPLIGAAPGARWLRTDVLRKRLAGAAPEQALPPQAYTMEASTAIYAHLSAQAGQALKAGMAVIVDGVFARQSERAAIARVAAACRVPFIGLWLEAPREVLHERVAGRQNDASDADGAVVDRQLDMAIGDVAPWARLPATGSPATVLQRATDLIGARMLAPNGDDRAP